MCWIVILSSQAQRSIFMLRCVVAKLWQQQYFVTCDFFGTILLQIAWTCRFVGVWMRLCHCVLCLECCCLVAFVAGGVLCERFGAFFWTVMGVPWMLDFVAGTLSHRLSMVRFSVCTFCAAKSIFELFFWGATLPLWTVHGFWWQSHPCCAGCHPCDLWRCGCPPASCVLNRCFL